MSTDYKLYDMDAARAERRGDAVHVRLFAPDGSQCTLVLTTLAQSRRLVSAALKADMELAQIPAPLYRDLPGDLDDALPPSRIGDAS